MWTARVTSARSGGSFVRSGIGLPTVWKWRGRRASWMTSQSGVHRGSRAAACRWNWRRRAADAAALENPLHLFDRCLHGLVGDGREPRVPVGLDRAEVGQPLVVDAHDLGAASWSASRRSCREPRRGPRPERRRAPGPGAATRDRSGAGRRACRPRRVPSRPCDRSGGSGPGCTPPPRRAHAVHEPRLAPCLVTPHRPLRAVAHVRHAVAQGRRGVGGEEIGRQPAEIDVAVGRDIS